MLQNCSVTTELIDSCLLDLVGLEGLPGQIWASRWATVEFLPI